MDKYIPTREETYKLLTKYVQDPSLINHALMVEAVMGILQSFLERKTLRNGVL